MSTQHKDQQHSDTVNHPSHYTQHPSGIECIQVTEQMNFCLGNAVKYIWRCDDKDGAIEDLRKACWYLEREIARRQQQQKQTKALYCDLCGRWDSHTEKGVCPECQGAFNAR